MSEDEFEAAWLAARGLAARGQGGGFDDAEVARRVLGAGGAGTGGAGTGEADAHGAVLKPSQAIISVSLDDLDGTDGDLLS